MESRLEIYFRRDDYKNSCSPAASIQFCQSFLADATDEHGETIRKCETIRNRLPRRTRTIKCGTIRNRRSQERETIRKIVVSPEANNSVLSTVSQIMSKLPVLVLVLLFLADAADEHGETISE